MLAVLEKEVMQKCHYLAIGWKRTIVLITEILCPWQVFDTFVLYSSTQREESLRVSSVCLYRECEVLKLLKFVLITFFNVIQSHFTKPSLLKFAMDLDKEISLFSNKEEISLFSNREEISLFSNREEISLFSNREEIYLFSNREEISLFSNREEISLFSNSEEISLFSNSEEISLFSNREEISLFSNREEISLFSNELRISLFSNELRISLFSNR